MNQFAQLDAYDQTHMQVIGAIPAPEEPTPLVHETPPGDPFPVDALGPLRDAALEIQARTQAPVAIGAQSLLAATSLATQGLCNVRCLGGERPLSIYVLTIAKSGERKSSCDALAMAPIRDFERTLHAQSSIEATAYANDQAIWDQTRTKLIKDAAGTGEKATSARVDLESLGSEPEPPLYPHLTASDPTFEGLTRNLDRSRPTLGIFSDEAGQFLGGHAMNSDNRVKTIAGLSKFWDGDPINRTRAGDGVKTYYGRRLCAHLMVQPGIADMLLGDPRAQDQGFLARFLICQPQSTIGSRLISDDDPGLGFALEAHHRRVSELLDQAMPLREGTRNELDPPILELATNAKSLLIDYANAIEVQQGAGRELCGATAFASKSAEQATRLAGILAVYAGENVISGERMANGIGLADWYLSEAVRLKDGAAISADIQRAEKLRLWLQDRWEEDFISVTVLVQSGAANIKSANEARKIIAQLVTNGWLVAQTDGAAIKGKHRKEAWRVIRGCV